MWVFQNRRKGEEEVPCLAQWWMELRNCPEVSEGITSCHSLNKGRLSLSRLWKLSFSLSRNGRRFFPKTIQFLLPDTKRAISHDSVTLFIIVSDLSLPPWSLPWFRAIKFLPKYWWLPQDYTLQKTTMRGITNVRCQSSALVQLVIMG